MGKILALTGHRPNKLWGYDLSRGEYRTVADALAHLIEEEGIDRLISGMALGFDQLGAQVALDTGISLVAAVPFAGQESKWPEASQAAYNRILDAADTVVTVCEGGYSAAKMQRRNEWMVDHADIVAALWDGTAGGTANCVRYATSRGARLLRLDPRAVSADARCEFANTSGR